MLKPRKNFHIQIILAVSYWVIIQAVIETRSEKRGIMITKSQNRDLGLVRVGALPFGST